MNFEILFYVRVSDERTMGLELIDNLISPSQRLLQNPVLKEMEAYYYPPEQYLAHFQAMLVVA